MNTLADINTFVGIMQATTAPAMIISGLAFLLSIMAGRYARCIDRTREILNVLDDQHDRLTEKKRKESLYQLKIIYKRCRQLRTMMILASLCVFFVVLTISAIFVGLLYGWVVQELAAILFVMSLVLLSTSMGYFVIDLGISLYGIKREITDVEKEFKV